MTLVSELKDAQLDYWVAKADKLTAYRLIDKMGGCWVDDPERPTLIQYSPSTDWSQGGPIIEMERIEFAEHANRWDASLTRSDGQTFNACGETHLIAAMRCLVASKFGEEVPDE